MSNWTLVLGIFFHALLAFVLGSGRYGVAFSIVGISLSMLAAVLSWFAASLLAFRGRFALLVIGLIGSLSVAILFAPHNGVWQNAHVSVMLIVGGSIVGWWLSHYQKAFPAYLIGLIVVILFALTWILPIATELIEMILESGDSLIARLDPSAVGLGGEKPTEGMIDEFKGAIAWLSRLVPGVLLLNIITQFSAATLLFFSYVDRIQTGKGFLKPFSRWLMPFWLMPILPFTVGAKFLENDSVKLFADNLLLILAVFYCVTGLSLLSHLLKKIKMSTMGKVGFYILLTLSREIGFLALGLAGLVDSFFDWRKISSQEEQLEKSIE